MREIKFRAWDKKTLQMSPEFALFGEFTLLGAVHTWQREFAFDIGAEDYSDSLGRLNDLIIMQYTGLKDKNSKEIFAGDIVNCSSGCPHVVEWREEIGGEFFGGMPGWYLSGLLTGGGKGYAWTGKEKRIGNIFQNPELLKG